MSEDIVWPYPALPEDGRAESYEWNTSIILGYGFEQRVSHRVVPKFFSEATFDLSPAQLQQAKTLITDSFRSYNRLLLPLWSERVFLYPQHIEGTMTQLFGDFRFSKFDQGGRALIYQSENTYYPVTVKHALPDRIIFDDYVFPLLPEYGVLALPLLVGRVDGDAQFELRRNKRHTASFKFRATDERSHRYRLNLCLFLDGSGSMLTDSRNQNMISAIEILLDYIQSFVESPLVDLSIRIQFCSTVGNPYIEFLHVDDAQRIDDIRQWVMSYSGTTLGVFSLTNACSELSTWFQDFDPATNIAVILTDADDMTEPLLETCESLLADVLDTATSPYSIQDGTAINLYTIGVASNPSQLALLSRLSTIGGAISLNGTSLAQFHRVLQSIVFNKSTPLAFYPDLLDGLYDGLPVLSRRMVTDSDISETITRARTVFDTASGPDSVIDTRDITDQTTMLDFEFMSNGHRQAALVWLHAMRGQKRAFYYPAVNRDFIVDTAQPDVWHIHVRRRGLDNPLRLLGTVLQIETSNGEILYRRIVNAVYADTAGNTLRLTLDSATPRILGVRDIFGIRVMRRMRFSSDVAEVSYTSANTSRLSMAAVTVSTAFVPPDDPPEEDPWPLL